MNELALLAQAAADGMADGPWWFVIALILINALPQVVKKVMADKPMPEWLKVGLTSWNALVPLIMALPPEFCPGDSYVSRLLAAGSAAGISLIAYNVNRTVRNSESSS